MLGLTDANRIRGSFESTIDLLGTEVTWEKADASAQLTFRSGMRTVGKDDVELVNAYGMDTRIFTAKSVSFGSEVPAEFDRITVVASRLRYALASVHEIWMNDVLIGYRMMGRADR